MPNFKAYLDALFKTRTTPAEAAAASAPDWNKKITIYSGTSANPVTQTAPSDGYYLQQVNGYPSQGYNDISCPNTTRAFLAYSIESISMVRVSKGDQVTMSVLSFESIAARTLNFIPCIGGGYRLLLKALQSGGATCLRLKNTFDRSSNSPVLRRCRQLTTLISESRQTLIGLRFTRQVLTAMLLCSAFIAPLLRFPSSPRGFEPKLKQLFLQEFLFLFGKVTSSTSLPTIQTLPSFGLGSSKLSALPSLSANCEEVRYVA